MVSNIRLLTFTAISIGALLLACCALWYRSDSIEANGKLAQITGERDRMLLENQKQAAALLRLTDLDKKKDALLADISTQLSAIHVDVTQTSQTLRELENTDEDVRAFINLALPADLQRVLNRK